MVLRRGIGTAEHVLELLYELVALGGERGGGGDEKQCDSSRPAAYPLRRALDETTALAGRRGLNRCACGSGIRGLDGLGLRGRLRVLGELDRRVGGNGCVPLAGIEEDVAAGRR